MPEFTEFPIPRKDVEDLTSQQQEDVRAAIGAVPDAPADGKPYARQDGDWAEVDPMPDEVTAAEALAGTEPESRTFSPLRVRQAIEKRMLLSNYAQFHVGRLALVTSGSGSVAATEGASAAELPTLTSGSTSGSFARLCLNSRGYPMQGGIVSWRFNFSRRMVIATSLAPANLAAIYDAGAGGEVLFQLGANLTENGILVRRGFGFAIRKLSSLAPELDVFGIAHNGTTLSTTASLLTHNYGSSQHALWLAVVSDGAGNIEFWVNGVLAATSTGGPTGLGVAIGDANLGFEVRNGNQSANATAIVGPVIHYWSS